MSKKSLDGLLMYMMEKRYKMVCDVIKVKILDSLIKLCLEREKTTKVPAVSKFDLFLIKDKLEEIREKETKEEREALVTVMTNLTSRGNDGADLNTDSSKQTKEQTK